MLYFSKGYPFSAVIQLNSDIVSTLTNTPVVDLGEFDEPTGTDPRQLLRDVLALPSAQRDFVIQALVDQALRPFQPQINVDCLQQLDGIGPASNFARNLLQRAVGEVLIKLGEYLFSIAKPPSFATSLGLQASGSPITGFGSGSYCRLSDVRSIGSISRITLSSTSPAPIKVIGYRIPTSDGLYLPEGILHGYVEEAQVFLNNSINIRGGNCTLFANQFPLRCGQTVMNIEASPLGTLLPIGVTSPLCGLH